MPACRSRLGGECGGEAISASADRGAVGAAQRIGGLNLCYVASGRVDGFWSTSLKPWDMAAGVLIVERRRQGDTDRRRGVLPGGSGLAGKQWNGAA